MILILLQKEILPLTNSSDTPPESGPRRIITGTLTTSVPISSLRSETTAVISHGLCVKRARQTVRTALGKYLMPATPPDHMKASDTHSGFCCWGGVGEGVGAAVWVVFFFFK